MVFTLRHGGYVGAHLQKNFNELLLLCAPTWPSWPLSFESHRTEGHVSENHLLYSFVLSTWHLSESEAGVDFDFKTNLSAFHM